MVYYIQTRAGDARTKGGGCLLFKADRTVLRETRYILCAVVLFSALMQAVFLCIGQWTLPVLFGNLLGGAAAVLNFFFMGLTLQANLEKDEKDARTAMRASWGLRSVALFAAAVLGVTLSCFNTVTSLVPLIFPRIAIAFRPLFDRKKPDGAQPPQGGE